MTTKSIINGVIIGIIIYMIINIITKNNGGNGGNGGDEGPCNPDPSQSSDLPPCRSGYR